jgi:hypothetical protein
MPALFWFATWGTNAQVNRYLAPLLFGTYTLLAVFILINMFLAILRACRDPPPPPPPSPLHVRAELGTTLYPV